MNLALGRDTGPWAMIYPLHDYDDTPMPVAGAMYSADAFGFALSAGVRRLRHGLVVGWMFKTPQAWFPLGDYSLPRRYARARLARRRRGRA